MRAPAPGTSVPGTSSPPSCSTTAAGARSARWGGYGELVSAPARVVVPLEPGDDLQAVAAGQCVVSTAWHMVNRLALVRPGDLVLVPSASGGVAGALVQCAKLAGA